jgi:RHS repeat-associated protein
MPQPENQAVRSEKAANGSFAAAPSITLPKGGGAIRGIGEKFAANPVTGTGSMSVPIAVSPGRSGFGPQLNLSYDSGSGNGPFGFGWSLSLPSITRKTDKGLPQYLDAEESDEFILSGAEDLVPVLLPDGTRFKDDTTFPGYIIHRYCPRVEGLFARIERWTDVQTGETHWRSISRDNITSLYGAANPSRIFDPANLDPVHPTRIFSWLICASYDDKGNAIVYEYVQEDSANIDTTQANERNRTDSSRSANRYLKYIRYGNRKPNRGQNWHAFDPTALTELTDWMFEVVFDYDEGHFQAISASNDDPFYLAASLGTAHPWTARRDPFSSYRAGFEVRTYRLCRRVLMFHHFPVELHTPDCLVRSTEFAYGESPIASFITSVTQSGYILRPDPAHPNRYLKKSLPPLEFKYTKMPDAGDLAQRPMREVDTESLENLPIGLDGANYQWMDLDGEGTSGILTEQGGDWYYKRNLSANNRVRDNGNEFTAARFGPTEVVGRKPAGGLAGGAQFLDLAGDGQVDLMQMEGPVRGFYERTDDADWAPFQPFNSWPDINTRDPELRFVDLTGDGHADILITESDTLIWHPSLAEDGFGPGVRLSLRLDEERGPRLVFADGTQSVYLADLSGDGLSDLVRIRNGEVCYWPNLGYGRFGTKVSMDNAPWFDAPDQFDQRRIRLVDIDGSGTTDILYLRRDGVQIYFNQSGNGWSGAAALPQFPPIDNISSVQALDLLGNGTACLVWSSPLPGDMRRPMRYIGLMEEKPHLLVSTVNNLGAETVVHYVSSTKFYLDDKRDGKPWITRLPFPVHVVDRVETYDRISRNRFVTRYAYHHGYFDGAEREFRGFGMVEEWDTEEIGTVAPGTFAAEDTNWDAASFVPPVLTRTWFHTGAYFEGAKLSRHFEDEYYREGDASRGESGLTDTQLRAMLLDDTTLPDSIRLPNGTRQSYTLSGEEAREACRSLKGSILRQEIYGLDGTDKADRPYNASERNYTIELLQPQGGNPHAVFFTHSRETVDFHYERELFKVDGLGNIDPQGTQVHDAADPRVTHALTLAVDEYGNVLQSVAIGYGRRFADPSLGTDDQAKQTKTLITYTENKYTNPIPDPDPANAVPDPDSHRAPLPCESRTFELVNITHMQSSSTSGMTGITHHFSFDEIVTQVQAAGDGSHDLLYEDLHHARATTDAPYRRPIEHVRTLYRANDLTGLMALGKVQSLALPGESYKLAFTFGLLEQVYFRGKENLLADRTNILGGIDGDRGGYVDLLGNGSWWIPSGRVFHSPGPNDGASEELAFARDHFFLPHRFRDPFQKLTFVAYDGDANDPRRNHNLLPVETKDALSNVATVHTADDDENIEIRNDYRVLQPYWLTDPNRNRTRVIFDSVGLVVGIAVMGKPGEHLGDRIDGTFDTDLSIAQTRAFIKDPIGQAKGLLQNATTRIVYDVDRFRRCGQPPFAATLAREIHACDPSGYDPPIQIIFLHSNGFGREIQTKIQAEPGDAPARDEDEDLPAGDIQPGELDRDGGKIVQANCEHRWVGTGRTVYNNKGKPIKKYEPFFSGTHLFETEPDLTDTGVTPILFYDPAERVVVTLHPNHTLEKVLFDPWRQENWDVNDTVLLNPLADDDVKGFFLRLPQDDYLPTWHSLRTDAAKALVEWPDADSYNQPIPENVKRRSIEKDAAAKSALHASTPTVVCLDTLGRMFLTIADNGEDANGKVVFYKTRVDFDIENNQRAVMDAQGRIVMRYDYDMLGNCIHQASMEAGESWLLGDAIGKPIRAWESRGFQRRTTYDELRRPIGLYVSEAGAERLAERTLYGESRGDVENHQTRIYQIFDGAGIVTSEKYDFKGNLLRTRRDLLPDYQHDVDWLQNPDADDGTFSNATEYDALNRPTAITTPDCSVYRPTYKQANLLEKVDVNLRGEDKATSFVTNIDHNAKGQRTLIQYSNGADTEYEYDPLTYRLIHLKTTRPAGLNGLASKLFSNPAIIQDLRYTYDPVGNITHISDDAIPTVNYSNQQVDPDSDYAYDAIYRLILAKGREHIGQTAFDLASLDGNYRDYPLTGLRNNPNDPQALRNYSEIYEYDDVGNFTSIQHQAPSGSWTRTFLYAADSLLMPPHSGVYSNRLTGTAIGSDPLETYTYDVHGNMIRMPHLPVMEWDFRDQLSRADIGGGAIAYYVYDTSGQRVRKVIHHRNGTRQKEHIYLGSFEIYREYDGSGGLTPELERETLHIMDDKQRIALVETKTRDAAVPASTLPDTLIRFQFANHLDSASLELDEDAQVISYEEYSPYGGTSFQAVRSQTETPKRYRYTGKERDEETGLNYHGARYYASWLGRWTSCDPAGLVDGPNLFTYSRNKPTCFYDKTGKQTSAEEKKIAEIQARLDKDNSKYTHLTDALVGGGYPEKAQEEYTKIYQSGQKTTSMALGIASLPIAPVVIAEMGPFLLLYGKAALSSSGRMAMELGALTNLSTQYDRMVNSKDFHVGLEYLNLKTLTWDILTAPLGNEVAQGIFGKWSIFEYTRYSLLGGKIHNTNFIFQTPLRYAGINLSNLGKVETAFAGFTLIMTGLRSIVTDTPLKANLASSSKNYSMGAIQGLATEFLVTSKFGEFLFPGGRNDPGYYALGRLISLIKSRLSAPPSGDESKLKKE